tara:strand:- start:660 stop:1028 length:369 start_codon:yes stop_codon:yes gene_type:complete
MVKSKESLFGAYAFLVGVVLAIIFGIFNESLERAGGAFYSTLVFIGLIVGFSNTDEKGSGTFLIASISLVIVGALGKDALLFISQGNYVVNILRNVLGSLMVLFIPATIIVSLKTVFAMAKV